MDTTDTKIKLRPFRDTDTELFAKWLYAGHVARWFEHPQNWLDEIQDTSGEYAFIRHFIAELDGQPIGFCQYYEYSRGGEAWHGDIDTGGAYSIDYMIGEPAYLKKGCGKAIIAGLTAKIQAVDGARRIIVQPDPENKASCAALLSAGYVFDDVNKLYSFMLTDGI